MQKLLSGFAFVAAVLLQGGAAVAQSPYYPACSAQDKPTLFNTKTHQYALFPAATSQADRERNIAMAKQMMAANPNLKPLCRSAAVKVGGTPTSLADFGGVNALPKTPPPQGPPAHTN